MNKEMVKRILTALVLGIVLVTLLAGPSLADPVDYDRKVEKGIYYLVAKDANWNPLPRATSPFGMGKFSIKGDTLAMRLVAHKLTPGDWYYVELVDKSAGWDPFNDDQYSRFLRAGKFRWGCQDKLLMGR